MGCQYYSPTEHGADSFTVAMPRLTVGRGTLSETGARAVRLGMRRVALFTDAYLETGHLVSIVKASLNEAGIDVAIFSEIRIEPDDDSVERGVRFLRESTFNGMISVGGGSVIDTAKACLVVLAHGGNILDYFAQPIGNGAPVPGPLLAHIACPTTSGTGTECTSISVLRINRFNTKFVIASPYMLPDAAIVDPQCCDSLPSKIVASTGFDLCCHALECYTAKAYTRHTNIDSPDARQYIQGANPFSEMAAKEALTIVGNYLERGVNDANDSRARDQLMWGATLAGIAFGNCGTHLPHAMSYGVTHLMHDIVTDGYSIESPFIPHGISVIVTAPSIFKYTAEATPERHLKAAEYLLADNKGARPDDAGEVLAQRLIELMRATTMPNGLTAIGFAEHHVSALAASSIRQGKAIANSPRESNQHDLENLYRSALSHW